MRKIREVLRLKHENGLSNGEIARSLSLSKSTVASYLERTTAGGVIWPLAEGLDFEGIYRKLFEEGEDPPGSGLKCLPEWEKVAEELTRKGVTLMLLWEEYRKEYPEGYGYTQYCKHYRAWAKGLEVSMIQSHKAGDKVFVDYSGDKIRIIDSKTGNEWWAELFVGVLGASNYTYAEASQDQSLASWIGSHVRMYAYFGGVPKATVPDNLKSGVSRPCFYEPEVNQTYSDMAAYYGTAILPARVYKPKDKAKVETGVKIAQQRILAVLRDRRFYSLAEANAAILEALEALNHRPMQKIRKSRCELFEAIDRPALRPLPEQGYELAEWSTARVHIDYHVEVAGGRYSVPFTLSGEKVEVRRTETAVEIFHRGKRVASHRRLPQGNVGPLTVSEHMPSSHRRYAEWSPERMLSWGNKIAPEVGALFKRILDEWPHPEQGFRACLGIINLKKTYGPDRLTAACRRALVLGSPRYRTVKNLLESGLEKVPEAEGQPVATIPIYNDHENLRGGDYYAGEMSVEVPL